MSKSFRAKSRLAGLWCCCALTIGLTSAPAASSAAATPPAEVLIARPIDPGRLYTLAGNTRAEANAQNDRGKLADSFALDHMLLQLQRSPERESALRSFIDRQYDAKSPNFHKWLTAAEFGRMYGPAPQDIRKVSDWLRASGFAVNTVYPSGMVIDFSGTAGQVAAAFHTEIHSLSVNGKAHIANMSDPRIPEALAPAVAGIVSLHDFRPRPMWMPRGQYTATGQDGLTYYPVVPADLATIYDISSAFTASPAITGQGQTIAVLEDTDLYSEEDWIDFRSEFGLSGYGGTLSTIHPAPNCTDPGVNGDDVEAIIDAEWASASAPGATIELAACQDTNTTSGLMIAAQNLINGGSPPQIVSVSYGECEVLNGAAMNAALNAVAQQAVSEGISVFVSTGDTGAAQCDEDFGFDSAVHGIGVSGYATTPYVVAVGGTDFADTSQATSSTYWSSTNSSTYGSALSYVPEIPWNDSCASSVTAAFYGYSVSYGTDGFCGSSIAQEGYITLGAGSGGPSGCATGAPTESAVVSGSCQGWPKPSWQAGVAGIASDGVRDIPDVALFASNGVWLHFYVVCFSDPNNGGVQCTGEPAGWVGAGGTSFAAPIWAGIQALVNQKEGGAQGNPNPVYYKLAASSEGSSIFHSITTGDIAVNCSGDISCFGPGFEGRGRATPTTEFVGNGALSTTGGTYTPAFAAGSGWSFATGLGSVDVFNLISNWSSGQ